MQLLVDGFSFQVSLIMFWLRMIFWGWENWMWTSKSAQNMVIKALFCLFFKIVAIILIRKRNQHCKSHPTKCVRYFTLLLCCPDAGEMFLEAPKWLKVQLKLGIFLLHWRSAGILLQKRNQNYNSCWTVRVRSGTFISSCTHVGELWMAGKNYSARWQLVVTKWNVV